MKYLLALLIMLSACTNVTVYSGNEKPNFYLLAEYNLPLYMENYSSPICGTTLTSRGIVTASHCVNGPPVQLYVQDSTGSLYPVEVIAIDSFETTDIAVLSIPRDLNLNLRAEIAKVEPEVGQDVWITGCGAGECDAFSYGIVSKIYVRDHYGMIANQFDATIWYGNSGGGIFDSDNKLVGVVSQFGPQFNRQGGGEPETGWLYGCPVKAIRQVTEDALR
ncbi:MAG: hypothetical protein DRN26_00210 [Thermoplasmata archaeon]|nr:MAG: hypothetical protein DRN26_00210 [Thermoplasmata archaeon]